jgi:hypothetical protein
MMPGFYLPPGLMGRTPIPTKILGGVGTIISNMSNNGAQANAFDGVTSQANTTGPGRTTNVTGIAAAYIGKTFSPRKTIFQAYAHGSNSNGYAFNGNPAITLYLYAKNGAAPSGPTDGTLLGSITFTDTNNESTGRTILSNDVQTEWDHVWLGIGAASDPSGLYCAEVVFWSADRPEVISALLLQMNGANGSTSFVDAMSRHSPVANGNAQISTAQAKFGSASGLFDGSGDYVSVADSSDWDFGADDFTIDMWVRPASTGQTAVLCGQRATHTGVSPFLVHPVSGTMQFFASSNGSSHNIANGISFGSALAANTWHHIAVMRSGATFLGAVGGVVSTLTTSELALFSSSSVLHIGGDTSSNFFNGHIDELRISKGIARWTANFTPPAAPYI